MPGAEEVSQAADDVVDIALGWDRCFLIYCCGAEESAGHSVEELDEAGVDGHKMTRVLLEVESGGVGRGFADFGDNHFSRSNELGELVAGRRNQWGEQRCHPIGWWDGEFASELCQAVSGA